MLVIAIKESLNELISVLHQLSDDDYSIPCTELSGASVGEHTRHIIEMFQCLQHQYKDGIINYDKRERNVVIQTNCSFAVTQIELVKSSLGLANKSLLLQQVVGNHCIAIESNYNRELLYNLEHCIHHQALIKVALLQFRSVIVNKNFGVASSTIEYKKQCVQ